MAGLLQSLDKQNFGPDDSMIASAVRHPLTGLLKAKEWLEAQMNTGMGMPYPQDEGSIYQYAPLDMARHEAALNIAGLAETGSIPFAPKSRGGILGTVARKADDLPETEFSKAHKIAQKNAALSIDQGGLGLPPDNTAMDRAAAMGFDTDAYHGRNSGKSIPKENEELAKYLREKYNNIENVLRDKYGLTNGRYNVELWKDDDLYTELNNLEKKAHTLESEKLINPSDITGNNFDPSISRDLGTHFSSDYDVASKFGENGIVYPVMLKSKNMAETNDIFYRVRGLVEALDELQKNKIITDKNYNSFIKKAHKLDNKKVPDERDWGMGKDVEKFWNNLNKEVIKNNSSDISYINEVEGGDNSYAIFDPKNIRSRFAAFDPMKKNSSNLLASGLLGSLVLNDYARDK